MDSSKISRIFSQREKIFIPNGGEHWREREGEKKRKRERERKIKIYHHSFEILHEATKD